MRRAFLLRRIPKVYSTIVHQADFSTSTWKPQSALPLKKKDAGLREKVLPARGQPKIFDEKCKAAGIAATVGFIGGGNMARALIDGFLGSGMISPDQIGVSDPTPQALASLKERGISAEISNRLILERFGSGITLLCVKPNILPDFLAECGKELESSGLVVSVLAGTTIASIEEKLNGNVPVIRVMPNTPALIGCGASVFARNQHASDAHCALVQSLLETVGSCREVPEYQLDAVTGLSGSGPAYVYTIIDALSDGGVKQGLPRDLSIHLAAQTVMGAAKMVLDSGSHPGVLKNSVCSPGGTTIAGVHALEEKGIRSALIAAVEAATLRAKELGDVKKD